MAAQGQLIACGQPAFASGSEPSRFVEVSPFSLAFVGKPRGPGEVLLPDEREEISTVHADKAILEFDRPVASVQDMREKCKMVAMQMLSTPDVPSTDARRGKVWVTNNQKSADPGQFLVFNTVGPVNYRSPDDGPAAVQFIRQLFGETNPATAEVELLFHPGSGSFSRSTDCRVLVADNPLLVPERLKATADVIVPNHANKAAAMLMRQLSVSESRNNQFQRAAA